MALSAKAAKEHCGYQEKPVFQTCGNCGAVASDFAIPAWAKPDRDRQKFEDGSYAKVEKSLRCPNRGFVPNEDARL